jgi:inhibitor of KinA sporulation pathway (predicted exonuclease)
MNRISLDLELEQPKTNHQTPDSLLDEEKIIEVGWVVFDDNNGEIISRQSHYINIGVPLSGFIKSLTGITDQNITEGSDNIVSIYKVLLNDMEKFKTSRKILTWGGGDQECVVKELKENGYTDFHFGRSSLNVKHMHQTWCEAKNIKPNGGLAKSMLKHGLNFKGRKHGALADAENTAIIFMKMFNELKEGREDVQSDD